MAFDQSKPHGTVHGAKDGSKYEQNGKHYDSQGNEVGTAVEGKKSKTVITPPPAKKEAEGSDPQLDAQNQ